MFQLLISEKTYCLHSAVTTSKICFPVPKTSWGAVLYGLLWLKMKRSVLCLLQCNTIEYSPVQYHIVLSNYNSINCNHFNHIYLLLNKAYEEWSVFIWKTEMFDQLNNNERSIFKRTIAAAELCSSLPLARNTWNCIIWTEFVII